MKRRFITKKELEMKSKTIVEFFTDIIDKEIRRYNDNPASDLHKEFQDGIKQGLEYAKMIFINCEEILDDLVDDICSDAVAEEIDELRQNEYLQAILDGYRQAKDESRG